MRQSLKCVPKHILKLFTVQLLEYVDPNYHFRVVIFDMYARMCQTLLGHSRKSYGKSKIHINVLRPLNPWILFNECLHFSSQIPDLAAFWMFSLILQLPLQMLFFLLNTMPGEMAVQGVMCLLLLSQLVFGFVVLRDMAKHHKLRFHISQFYNGQHDKTE